MNVTIAVRPLQRLQLFAGCVLLAQAVLLAAPAPAATPRETAAAVLSLPAYQRDLPAKTRQVPARPPAPDLAPPNLDLTPPEWLQSVARLLAICLLGAGAIGIAVYLSRRFADAPRRGDPFANNRESPGTPAAEVKDPTLQEADALAASGRFAEAMHLLLAAALHHLRRRAATGLADSLTSREVIGAVRISDERRAALLDIVGNVEVSHFGGRAVDAGGYEHCRVSYAMLVDGSASRDG